MAKVSIIIPGNTKRIPAAVFSNPDKLNFLKVNNERKTMEGTRIKYRRVKIIGDSVIKKNCPAKRKAKVAMSQTKNPIKSTGRIKGWLVLFMFKVVRRQNLS